MTSKTLCEQLAASFGITDPAQIGALFQAACRGSDEDRLQFAAQLGHLLRLFDEANEYAERVARMQRLELELRSADLHAVLERMQQEARSYRRAIDRLEQTAERLVGGTEALAFSASTDEVTKLERLTALIAELADSRPARPKARNNEPERRRRAERVHG
jgi:predicted O-linked N-acetylglucosamine transferase (SPINDLY family)